MHLQVRRVFGTMTALVLASIIVSGSALAQSEVPHIVDLAMVPGSVGNGAFFTGLVCRFGRDTVSGCFPGYSNNVSMVAFKQYTLSTETGVHLSYRCRQDSAIGDVTSVILDFGGCPVLQQCSGVYAFTSAPNQRITLATYQGGLEVTEDIDLSPYAGQTVCIVVNSVSDATGSDSDCGHDSADGESEFDDIRVGTDLTTFESGANGWIFGALGPPDLDTDGDGTLDCHDGCPNDPAKIAPGQCGCGNPDTDTDGDGTADCNDGCPTDPNKITPGSCGCNVADTDVDGDSFLDCLDNCPTIPNPSQADGDHDGVGDACETGNDGCATPVIIVGLGPFAFDNSGASTGIEGQANANCFFNGTDDISNDLWYTWTAPSTGLATITTCNTTAVDTKIAIYPGMACPTAPAIGCNDDNCTAALQSSLCSPVTNGTTYVVQIGTSPGAVGGPGTFGFSIGASGVTPCKQDDGVSDDTLGWTAGGNMAWVQRFDLGASTSVSSIQVAWGSAAFPGTSPGNGSPARVLLYEDPNNDGDPSDVVLKQNIATTVANVDTDTLNTVSIPSTLMAGVFFAGAAEDHAAGQSVAVMDQTCPIGDQTWFFGDDAAVPATNFANPSASPIPIDSFLQNGFPANLLVRTCATSPMIGECFPGTGGVINCPCPSQAPANPAGGCANHGAGSTSGGVLSASGVADVSADTLVITVSGMRPSASVLNVFFSYKPGTATPTPGIVSGAGVRCIGTGGSLKRLYTANATGGSLSKPGMGDLSVSAVSASFSGHAIVPPETRHYFNVYRDGQASQPATCNNPAVTTNLTNMGAVTWVP